MDTITPPDPEEQENYKRLIAPGTILRASHGTWRVVSGDALSIEVEPVMLSNHAYFMRTGRPVRMSREQFIQRIQKGYFRPWAD